MTDLVALIKKNVDNCDDIYNLLLEFSIELKINCDLNIRNVALQNIMKLYCQQIIIIKEKMYPFNQKKRKLDEIIKITCDHPYTLVKSEREWDGHRSHTSYYCKQCNSYVRYYKILRI